MFYRKQVYHKLCVAMEVCTYYTSVGSTTKGGVVKRSDCILVYGSTTKGDVVKRSDCILVYGSTTKGGVVKRSDCILVYGSTTKGDVVKRSDCILVYGSTTKGGVVEWSDCNLRTLVLNPGNFIFSHPIRFQKRTHNSSKMGTGTGTVHTFEKILKSGSFHDVHRHMGPQWWTAQMVHAKRVKEL